MKIKIEIDDNLIEDEFIIKCSKLDENIQKIQAVVSDLVAQNEQIAFMKDGKEYYFSLNDILFFETNSRGIDSHTENDVFQVKYKLYELEEILPSNFVRVSKSTILNVNKIYSIDKNIMSTSTVQFYKTHKQVHVSRHYYKQTLYPKLQARLAGKR
ncbi:MAG: LytTR family transcriptional regulator [Oscillospiraceae bacterium]|nr:LytTR family transcriptional regulator [Oscillospiraceae bacterium]